MTAWHWSWWGWVLMSAAMLAFWGAAFYLFADLVTGRSREPGTPTPERVLADRLARGDIDIDENRRRIDALGDDAQVGAR